MGIRGPDIGGRQRGFFKKKAGAVPLAAVCLVVFYLLFPPMKPINPARALQLAKASRDLSPVMSNEEFIASYEDSAGAPATVGWHAAPMKGGRVLVSYIYLDEKGVFKGWFFEILPKGPQVHRVIRSMGEGYSTMIDDRFEKSVGAFLEKEKLFPAPERTKEPYNEGTVFDGLFQERRTTRRLRSYGWTVRPPGEGKRALSLPWNYYEKGFGRGEEVPSDSHYPSKRNNIWRFKWH